jgi:hypothetical protein
MSRRRKRNGSPLIVFTRTYNHEWPSRAQTEFLASPTPRLVKAEVRVAALERGYARLATQEEIDGADGSADGVGDVGGGEGNISDEAGGLLAGGGGDGSAAGADG